MLFIKFYRFLVKFLFLKYLTSLKLIKDLITFNTLLKFQLNFASFLLYFKANSKLITFFSLVIYNDLLNRFLILLI